MKFLSDILAKAGLTVDGVVTFNNTATGQTPATNDNSTKLATTAFIKNQSYLTANQTITVSGDATGSGTTSIALTLANSGVTAGTYGNASNIPTIVVDSKGRITSITTNAVSIITTLAGLSDVTLTSPSTNQVLQYNGTRWVNGPAPTTYTLPIASASVLGGIKVGSGLSIDSVTGVLSASGTGGNVNFKSIQEFTATAGQTTFTIAGGYTAGYIDVLVNGVYLSASQYTATDLSTIVLTDPSLANDLITVFLYSLYNLGSSNYARNISTLTATAGQTVFTTSYIPGQIDIYYNGSKLSSSEFTATNGSSITLTQAAALGDILEVVTYLAGAGLNASRSLTINGVTYDLSADRSWTITNASLGAQPQLNGTGLVRMSGTTVTYDNASYATQSYVTTAIANLVNAAPSTLDTLNELAAALGNDASFSTTVTNSIATKQAQLNGTGFVKVSGTTVSYDNSTYALDSAVVKLSGSQTISGVKTFTGAGNTFTQNTNFQDRIYLKSPTTSTYSSLGGDDNKILVGVIGATHEFTFTPNTNYSYAFPAASGTLALTSNLSSYLLLAGGTLTGSLVVPSPFTIKDTNPYIQWQNSLGTRLGYIQHATNLVMSADSGNIILTTTSGNFTLASAGAATFNSSVTATQFITTSAGATGIVLSADSSDTNNSGRIFFMRTGGEGFVIMNNAGNLSFRSNSIPGNTSGNERMKLDSSYNLILNNGLSVTNTATFGSALVNYSSVWNNEKFGVQITNSASWSTVPSIMRLTNYISGGISKITFTDSNIIDGWFGMIPVSGNSYFAMGFSGYTEQGLKLYQNGNLTISGAATFSTNITVGTDVTLNNGILYVSAGSGTSYSSRLFTVYNYPYIETYLDSYAGASYEGRLLFRTNSGGGAMSTKLTIANSGNATFSGNILPASDAVYTLGSPSLRWNHVYTTDLHLSNQGKQNIVDGTWGDWTLQEGENDIFMLNNRSGEKFKIKLEKI